MTVAIKISSVVRHFPGAQALKGVSFTVKQGSIHGLLGPNGAGKSTLMKIMTGLIPATSGEVEILGINIKQWRKNAGVPIGHLPERPPLYLNMTVSEYLMFVALAFC